MTHTFFVGLFAALSLPILAYAQPADLVLYTINSLSDSEGNETHFVSLTDTYRWQDNAHPDSQAVAPRYLDDGLQEDEMRHELKGAFRRRFLRRTGIRETDRVFYYDLRSDKLVTRQVRRHRLVAIPSPYHNPAPVSQYDYMIGFEVSDLPDRMLDNAYNNVLVYVGERSPFQLGEVTRMVFDSIAGNLYPTGGRYADWQQRYERGGTYRFRTDEADYLAQEWLVDGGLPAVQLLVIDRKSGRILYDAWYQEGESTMPHRILTQYKTGYGGSPYTGAVLKDMPPIVHGFYDVSFGCVVIGLLGTSEYVPIQCDNRH